MSPDARSIDSIEDLRVFVYQTLSSQNNLEPHAYQRSERILTRRGAPCGIMFCIHGPRSVKLTAVWETDRQTILFYNSAGERTERFRLTGSEE